MKKLDLRDNLQCQIDNEEFLNQSSIRVKQIAKSSTLIFLISKIYYVLYKRVLKVGHSLGDGIFCYDVEGHEINSQTLEEINRHMEDLIKNEQFITERDVPINELIKHFKDTNRSEKINVVKAMCNEHIRCVDHSQYLDYLLEPMIYNLNELGIFSLELFQKGFVIRLPKLSNPGIIGKWENPSSQLEMFKEYISWANLIKVENISTLNEIIYKKGHYDLKWVCEGLHTRKLAKIAKTLVENFDKKRIITISGPSSSNKTTFAKRLSIALKVFCYDSIVIEMDDYFVNRVNTPKGPDGKYDFECVGAVNSDLLSGDIKKLLNGEKIRRRKFDFTTGEGYYNENEVRELNSNSFLIIEGIHGLNPKFLNIIGSEKITPIYVAPLTPLHIDNQHPFRTTDLRLIRRIIRDHRYRGFSARSTIKNWTSVRLGEEKNIFPYQNNAQLFFNSSLMYELPVLSVYGIPLLSEATVSGPNEDPDDPITKEVTREARRILRLLSLFYPIQSEEVPHISCIREFIGGSDFKY